MCICGCGSAKSHRKPIANLRICGCGTPLAVLRNLRCGIEFKFAVPSSDGVVVRTFALRSIDQDSFPKSSHTKRL